MNEDGSTLDQAKTKQQVAYEHIKKGIIRGDFLPNEKLILRTLAAKLSMSEIPIREALQRLEAEGMVQNQPHRGFLITEPDFKRHKHLFDVRQLLEGQAVYLAARAMSSRALRTLRSIHEEMKANIDDIPRLTELNYQFHDLIYASCGNPVLYNLIHQIWSSAPRTQTIFTLMKNRIGTTIEEHEAILLALETCLPEQARDALTHHKSGAYDLLIRYSESLEATSGQKDQRNNPD